MPLGRGPGALRYLFIQPVEFRHPLVDQLTPSPQQVLQFGPLRIRFTLGGVRQGKDLAEPGQDLGVQTVGLRFVPAGPGEGPHLVWDGPRWILNPASSS